MNGVAKLVFEVPGSPRGKGRHRAGVNIKTGAVMQYADKQTESYEAQIKWFARQAMGAHGLQAPLTGPLWMQVTAFTAPSKVQQKAMAKNPHATHYSTVRPDWDNIAKVVADSLNGIAYRDDAVIADGRVVKCLGESTRIVVSIGCLEGSA